MKHFEYLQNLPWTSSIMTSLTLRWRAVFVAWHEQITPFSTDVTSKSRKMLDILLPRKPGQVMIGVPHTAMLSLHHDKTASGLLELESHVTVAWDPRASFSRSLQIKTSSETRWNWKSHKNLYWEFWFKPVIQLV